MVTATKTRCAICGERAIVASNDPVTVELRVGTYTVEGFEYTHCTACGEDFHPLGQSDEMRVEASRMAREEFGLLQPLEIRQLRHDLGLTQRALEDVLGVGEKTVARWERGIYPQSRTADTLMRLVWAHPELVAETGFVAREGRGPYRTRGE
ncbi:MAG: type II toxin-antitoxin system MqsA family antitoxin [Coriobacteriia bacterium]|nr:type II toxin-antitoxin system MqsA family antitoxin [Coriobacteriia bacterium]